MATLASGSSVFWALLATALGSTSQRGFCGWAHSGSFFEDSLWPHRTSPFVCVADSVVALVCLVKTRQSVFTRSRSPSSLRPGVRMMKLLIFVLGVLPQAVKVFSIQGIGLTKTLAGIFLFSQLIHFVHGYQPPDAEDEDGNKDRSKPGWSREKGPFEYDTVGTVYNNLICLLLGIFPHHICLVYVWVELSSHINLTVSEDAKVVIDWCLVMATGLMGLYVTSQIILSSFGPRYGRLRLPIITTLFWSPGLVTETLRIVRTDRRPTDARRYPPAIVLLSLVHFGAYFLVVGLKFCATQLLPASSILKSGSHEPPTVLPRTSTDVSTSVPQSSVASLSPQAVNADRQSPRAQANDNNTTPTTSSPIASPNTSQPANLGTHPSRTAGQEPVTSDSTRIDGDHQTNHARMQTSAENNESRATAYEIAATSGRVVERMLRRVLAIIFEGFSVYSNILDHSSHDVLWMAFGIVNVVTAGLVYAILFDNTNTNTPEWINILG